MQPGKSPRLRAWVHSIGAVAAVFVAAAPLAPVAAHGAVNGRIGVLSPRLAQLSRPAVRSASHAEQAKQLGLARQGPGSLLRAGNRVAVEVRFDGSTTPAVKGLRAAGATVLDVSREYRTVTIAAKPAQLRALSSVPGVTAATEVIAPLVYGPGAPEPSAALGPVGAAVTPCFGAATSEGDVQLRARLAREEFEVDGSGVKVGVLSDSFNRDPFADTSAADDVASGDLPGIGNPCGETTPVEVLDDSETEGADEGRAMAQIVHDLAPGADLSFATAFTSLTGFAENVGALASAGANVIVDDVAYFEEPFFQEGPVDVAAGNATEAGVVYLSAAGNDNLIDGGKDIASWEAPAYRDSGECPAAVVALSEEFEEFEEPGLHPTHCMDFNPGAGTDRTFGITIEPSETLLVDLQWAEPWEGLSSDIDAFLIGPGGEILTGSIDANLIPPQRPFEFFAWENETGAPEQVQLAINRYSGGTPRLKFTMLENGGGVSSTEYESSLPPDVVGPTIFGHAGGKDVVGVGAIPFNASAAPETYSSRGPVTHYFEPVNGTTPAGPIAPEELLKPEVVATDGGASTFFASCVAHTWRFFGTSAAAPHAAAVAALEREAAPGASVDEVKEAQFETAGPIGAFLRPGPAIGFGLVNAAAAVAKLKSEPFSEPEVVITPAAPQNCNLPKPPSPGGGGGNPNPPAATLPAFVPNFVAPPSTFFLWHPPKVIRTPRLKGKGVFRFGSDESDATFVCRVDGEPFRECRRRFVGRFAVGPHTMRAIARDAAGNADRTPAVYRFRVKRVG